MKSGRDTTSPKRSMGRLLGDTMIYGMSSIVGRFLNYLLVPLYTYKIAASSGGYGVVTEVYAYTALLLVMLTFGMETTFFYFANKYKEKADKVFSTAAWAVGSVSAMFVLAVFVLINPIATAMGYAEHPQYITTMAIVVAIDAFQAIFFALLRYEGRAWKFAALKLLFIFCNIGLNLLVFLVVPKVAESHAGWVPWYDASNQVGYIFTVNLICTAGVTIGFLPEIRKMRWGLNRGMLKEMLRYTWPLLLFGIAGILNQVADKMIYTHLVPGEEGRVQLGIYGACVKIALIMAMITQAFRYAYEPFVFGGGQSRDSKESQAKVMKYFVMFALLAFMVVVSYLDIFKYVIDSDYWEGLRVVPIVMMAEIMMSVYFNLSFWYKLIEQTWWGAIFSAIGCAVLVGVNVVFVPRWGYMACAWGGLAGYGVCVLLSYFVGQKKNPVPYNMPLLIGYLALALALYGVECWLKPEALGWRIALNTVLTGVYVGVMLYAERDLVKGAVRSLELKVKR